MKLNHFETFEDFLNVLNIPEFSYCAKLLTADSFETDPPARSIIVEKDGQFSKASILFSHSERTENTSQLIFSVVWNGGSYWVSIYGSSSSWDDDTFSNIFYQVFPMRVTRITEEFLRSDAETCGKL